MAGGANSQSFALTLDTVAIADFAEEEKKSCADAARPSAQAGAQVLYVAVQQNVAALGRKTGNLAASIYQAYSKTNSGPGVATYHVSWNHTKAPHGWLVEFGHIQRYVTYVGKDGKWHTAIQQGKGRMRKPGRKASQAEKNAYYVPLKGGPRQVAAQSFVDRARSQFPQALDAMEGEFRRRTGYTTS